MRVVYSISLFLYNPAVLCHRLTNQVIVYGEIIMTSSWIVGVLAFTTVKYTVLFFQYSTCTIAGSYCVSAILVLFYYSLILQVMWCGTQGMHFYPFLTDISGGPKAGTKSLSNNESMEITIIYSPCHDTHKLYRNLTQLAVVSSGSLN